LIKLELPLKQRTAYNKGFGVWRLNEFGAMAAGGCELIVSSIAFTL